MKALNRYILEKFQITKDSVLYTCHPKDKVELRKILEERLTKDKNADLNDIDVSQITDMHYISPNGYHGLFAHLDPHNIKIDYWDASNVKDMYCIFANCPNFKGEGLEKWDMSNVENMGGMFKNCNNFNGDLGNWNVSKVNDMYAMFYRCEKFEGNGLENWNLSNVKDMSFMFYDCKNFNCNLDQWDVSNVKDMECMFKKCENFEGKGLEKWKPKKCKDMKYMFDDCPSLKNKPSWYKN